MGTHNPKHQPILDMKTITKARTLTATLITFGLLVGGANAQLPVASADPSASDGLLTGIWDFADPGLQDLTYTQTNGFDDPTNQTFFTPGPLSYGGLDFDNAYQQLMGYEANSKPTYTLSGLDPSNTYFIGFFDWGGDVTTLGPNMTLSSDGKMTTQWIQNATFDTGTGVVDWTSTTNEDLIVRIDNASTFSFVADPVTWDTGSGNLSVGQLVPEPSSALLGVLAGGLFLLRRRRC